MCKHCYTLSLQYNRYNGTSTIAWNEPWEYPGALQCSLRVTKQGNYLNVA